ncbi:MAG: DUF4037 domain-containing protein [Firmicutes bacterium]|nr:DUF4037 domain-containing protein [Bacillota bacterium]MBE3590876.1 DUF4037 domain-containing protein [Bacillota bacterium]
MEAELLEWAHRRRAPDIAGILWEGSTARGVPDPEAEIDLRIVRRRAPQPPGPPEAAVIAGRRAHVRHSLLEELQQTEWTPYVRYSFATARILLDPDGQLRRLIERQLHLSDDRRRDEALFWYCELRSSWQAARRAFARGDGSDCAYSLTQVAEAAMRCYFGCTRDWVPYRKWLAHEFLQANPPHGLRSGVLQLLALPSHDVDALRGRLEVGRQLVEGCRDLVARRFGISRGRLDGWEAIESQARRLPV